MDRCLEASMLSWLRKSTRLSTSSCPLCEGRDYIHLIPFLGPGSVHWMRSRLSRPSPPSYHYHITI